MKILMACLHHPCSTGRYLYDAFQRIGTDIRHVGAYPNERAAESKWAWEPQGFWDVYWKDWTPDLVLYPETVYQKWRHSRYAHIPHACICTDNPVCDMRTLNMEHYFLADSHSALWSPDGERSTWLCSAYDPTLHVPGNIPWEDRLYDVAIVGAGAEPRSAYVKALRAEGLNVWWECGHYFADFVALYHNARISLCVNEYHSPMFRYFETAAMGNLVIGHTCPDLAVLNVDGVVFANSEKATVNTVLYYLDHPDQAQEMIARSMAWVKPHTWDSRARQIVEWYQKEYTYDFA